MSEATKQPARTGLEIAVIGLAGRFPKARNVREFWSNLQQGRAGVTFFTDEELLAAGVDRDLLQNPNYVKAKCIMDDVDRFDASFFGYTPREAEVMDPQMRLFHECVHEALEDAGYDPEAHKGGIGLFAGASANLYWQLMSLLSRSEDSAEQFAALSLTDKDFMNTRLAHKLGLRGPSVSVDTACSTSLVAVHLACRALLTGDCKIAVAGGATVMVPHENGYLYREGMIHSPDGYCRAFDAEAGGTVGGEGVGAVVLKPLKQALADRDHIYAVIKGSAINNDGTRKMAYTAPSIEGQAEVIRAAQRLARVEPTSITYVEAHGTATKLGDPVEIEALRLAFRTEETQYCGIGSVKTNIGHLDAAAGIAGLIKTVLALHHKELPPSLHFTSPNPKIDFANSPFRVIDQLQPWPADRGPRRAGVSSFGIGGTNAHVIVEEAPSVPEQPTAGADETTPLPFLISAKTEAALDRSTARLQDFLQKSQLPPLADISHTLLVGRKHFPHRRLFVAATREEALAKLADPTALPTGLADTSARPLTFLFSGQGSQYAQMGRQLYEREPKFRAELDSVLTLLTPLLGFDPKTVLFPARGAEEAANERLRHTELTQPLLFALEYALARWLDALGIRPTAMIGHSIGEYVAACLAGVFPVEAAVQLVVLRGRLMAEMPPGAMLSVPLSEAELLPLLGDDLSLAAINAPNMTVASGPVAAIDRLAAELEAAGHAVRKLHTSHAFHSAMMEPMLARFEAAVRAIALQPPTIPFLSNVTGTWITPAQATDPTYWAQQLRGAVRFADGVAELLQEATGAFLEVGPGRALCTFLRKHPARTTRHLVLPLLPHPQDGHDDHAYFIEAIGRLWVAGIAVQLSELEGLRDRHRVSLPTYPFADERYWLDMPSDPLKGLEMVRNRSTAGSAPQRRAALDEWFYTPSYERAPTAAPQTAPAGTCLVLLDPTSGVGPALAQHLRAAGADVVEAPLGDEAHYSALLATLHAAGQTVTTLVHTGGLAEGTPDEVLAAGYLNLLALARALGGQDRAAAVKLYACATGMLNVTGDEDLDPLRATLLGACQVIPAEYAHLEATCLDLVLPSDTTRRTRVIHALATEILAPTGAEVVACRGTHRFVQTFKPASFSEAPALREGGTYLLTGGLGGIGLTLGQHLAQKTRAKLVFTARSSFPAPSEWDAWIAAHGTADPVSDRIAHLREMEAAGAEVLILQADVADRARMEEIVRHVTERFGALHGVIHAAGVPDGALIMRRSPELETRVLEPKLAGTLALTAALQQPGVDLDFLLLCSSLATVTAPIGQVGYCAANHYLNAAAHHLQAQGVPAIAVNWDGWADVGMAAAAQLEAAAAWELQGNAAHLATLNELRLTPEEGAQVFERLLTHRAPQVMISTHDLTQRMADKHRLDLTKAGTPSPAEKTPGTGTSTLTAPLREIEQTVTEVIESFFGLQNVGVHDNFFELGASSLDLVQLNGKLQTKLGVEFPVTTLFTYPTVRSLAQALRPAEAAETPAVDRSTKLDEGKNRLKQRMNRRR